MRSHFKLGLISNPARLRARAHEASVGHICRASTRWQFEATQANPPVFLFLPANPPSFIEPCTRSSASFDLNVNVFVSLDGVTQRARLQVSFSIGLCTGNHRRTSFVPAPPEGGGGGGTAHSVELVDEEAPATTPPLAGGGGGKEEQPTSPPSRRCLASTVHEQPGAVAPWPKSFWFFFEVTTSCSGGKPGEPATAKRPPQANPPVLNVWGE